MTDWRRLLLFYLAFLSGGAGVAALIWLLFGDRPAQRTLEFSGYDWTIRRSDGAEGPGPNVLLDNRQTVWVDEAGALHLRVWSRIGRWYTAEVRLRESLGYGTYHFQTIGSLRFESPSVILGLFLYDHDAPVEHFREIDIEYGRFGDRDAPEGQFAVQPFDAPGNRHGFMLPARSPADGLELGAQRDLGSRAWSRDGPHQPLALREPQALARARGRSQVVQLCGTMNALTIRVGSVEMMHHEQHQWGQ